MSFLQRASMASPNGKECPIYNSQWLPLFARLLSLFKEKGEQRLQFSSSIFLYSAFEINTNFSHFGQPGISMLLINMSNSTTYEVSIENDVNLHPRRLLEDKENGGRQREEYHLTPRDGNIQSNVMLLNGTPLKLTKSLGIPTMNPKLVDTNTPIVVAPHSFVFATLKDFRAPACA